LVLVYPLVKKILMIINNLTLSSSDSITLAATIYQANPCSNKTVLINSGTGILRRYYDGFAQFLCAHGFTVVTYDYRGIGGSCPKSLRGFPATMRDWGQNDIAGVIAWITANLRPAKLFIIGHSAGGQVAGLAANIDLVNAMVFVAAQSGYWRHWPFPRRYWYACLWHATPLIANVFGYLPSRRLGIGQDLPRGVACEWAKWCRHPQYLFGYGQTLDLTHYASFTGPILAYSFADDSDAPAAAVDALLRGYSGALIVRKHIAPASVNARRIDHFGLFRERFRDTLWRDTVMWLEGQ